MFGFLYGRPEFKYACVLLFFPAISIGNDLTDINLLLSFQIFYGVSEDP